MRWKDVRSLEWLAALVLVLCGVYKALVMIDFWHVGSYTSQLGTWLCFGCTTMRAVLLVFALSTMCFMAQCEDRHALLFLVFTIFCALQGLLDMTHYALYGFTGKSLYTMAGIPTVRLMLMLAGLVTGVLVAVRLFLDQVQPLGTAMVCYVVLPVVVALMLPFVAKLGANVLQGIATVLDFTAVALLFIFQRASSPIIDDDF